jgi:hypothetical protein
MLKKIFRMLYCTLPVHKLKTTRDDFTGAKGIVVVAFGSHNDGEPIGTSNMFLANLAVRIANETGLPIAWQWEHTDGEQHDYPAAYTHGTRGDYHITTLAFCEAVRKKTLKWDDVVVVAHGDHIQRCAWVLEKLETRVRICDPADWGFPPIPYDKFSRQPWCRDKWYPLPFITGKLHPESWGFWWFERVARAYFALKGWI